MKPVGYKPRGQEKLKDKKEVGTISTPSTDSTGSETSTSPTNITLPLPRQGIPTVISSESIYKENTVSPPCFMESADDFGVMPMTSSSQCPHQITERLVTTDRIAIFEGMPFYLMTTIPSEKQTGFYDSPALCPIPVTSGGQDVQMEKAWEIGFAVARTMKEEHLSY